MSAPESLQHPFAPIADACSRVLILGSFPSVRSRAEGFYYGHPQNRFWRVLAKVYSAPVPISIEDKTRFLLCRRIALWDAAASCRIEGSSDASMRNIMPNDIPSLVRAHPSIQTILCNGQTAWRVYTLHCAADVALPCRALPSTSAANASYSLERLVEAWGECLTE